MIRVLYVKRRDDAGKITWQAVTDFGASKIDTGPVAGSSIPAVARAIEEHKRVWVQ